MSSIFTSHMLEHLKCYFHDSEDDNIKAHDMENHVISVKYVHHWQLCFVCFVSCLHIGMKGMIAFAWCHSLFLSIFVQVMEDACMCFKHSVIITQRSQLNISRFNGNWKIGKTTLKLQLLQSFSMFWMNLHHYRESICVK